MKGAADLMDQALELVPDWAAGWFRLADYQEKSGRKEAAIEALRKVLELNPDDIFGAGLKLALLGGAETPDQPSSRLCGAAVRRLCRPLRQGAGRKARLYRSGKTRRSDCGPYGDRASPMWSISAAAPACSANASATGRTLSKASTFRPICWRRPRDKGHLRPAGAGRSFAAAGTIGSVRQRQPAENRADLVSAADVLMYLGNLDSVVRHRLAAAGR